MSARVGLILLFVSVAAMLAHVWGLTRLVEMTQQRARLSARVDLLESANSHLRAEVGQLASADRVERLARSHLSLDFKSTEVRTVQVLMPAEER